MKISRHVLSGSHNRVHHASCEDACGHFWRDTFPPHIPPAKLTTALLAVLLLILAQFSTGCARMTQTLSTTTTQTNGVVETRTSKATGWAFWDAKQTLEKLRVSNGKTHSIGLTGSEQETSATNAAATVDALTRLLQTLR